MTPSSTQVPALDGTRLIRGVVDLSEQPGFAPLLAVLKGLKVDRTLFGGEDGGG